MLAWGKKVSHEFAERVQSIGLELGLDPSWLMAVMAFESGGTFSPSVRNAMGSGAVGLIQFMPQTVAMLGTTIEELAAKTAEEQLEDVRQYFLPTAHRVQDLADLYMAVLWPAGIGRSDDYVLFDKSDPLHPKRYLQNKGLDFNKDGKVTKAEAAAPVELRLKQGLLPENVLV